MGKREFTDFIYQPLVNVIFQHKEKKFFEITIYFQRRLTKEISMLLKQQKGILFQLRTCISLSNAKQGLGEEYRNNNQKQLSTVWWSKRNLSSWSQFKGERGGQGPGENRLQGTRDAEWRQQVRDRKMTFGSVNLAETRATTLRKELLTFHTLSNEL